VLLKPNKLPKDMYYSKTIIKGLDMDYEKIDVCKNNCMFFMKEHAERQKCLYFWLIFLAAKSRRK
jgi:hypothetical protein